MRCKRCGEQLEPMDTRCPVCGKAVAPRRKAPAQRSNETHIRLPQLDKFTHAYGEDVARSRMLQLATIAAVLLALVLLVLVFAGVGELKSAVNDLKVTADAQLQAIQNQPKDPEPTEGEPEVDTQPQEDPTEETQGQIDEPQPQALPLSRQTLAAELTLYRGNDGAYAAAWMELGDYEDRAQAWVSTTREGSRRETSVSWILEESGDRLDLTLSERYGGDDAAQLTLSWNARGETFRSMGNPVCIWEYRVVGDGWESLPAEYLNPIGGGCELAISADQLTLLMAQYSEMELRCQVSMTHPSGGTMNVLVDGISFDAEGLTVSGSLLD